MQAHHHGLLHLHMLLLTHFAAQNGAGELDAPTLSYAFHTAFAPAGTMLRATASDLDLLGGHVLVRPT